MIESIITVKLMQH